MPVFAPLLRLHQSALWSCKLDFSCVCLWLHAPVLPSFRQTWALRHSTFHESPRISICAVRAGTSAKKRFRSKKADLFSESSQFLAGLPSCNRHKIQTFRCIFFTFHTNFSTFCSLLSSTKLSSSKDLQFS